MLRLTLLQPSQHVRCQQFLCIKNIKTSKYENNAQAVTDQKYSIRIEWNYSSYQTPLNYYNYCSVTGY